MLSTRLIQRLLKRLCQVLAALITSSAQRLRILVTCFRHFVAKLLYCVEEPFQCTMCPGHLTVAASQPTYNSSQCSKRHARYAVVFNANIPLCLFHTFPNNTFRLRRLRLHKLITQALPVLQAPLPSLSHSLRMTFHDTSIVLLCTWMHYSILTMDQS
ncbi:hypothetical protein EDB19DRAFT_1209690 [Suillus lakei]|nr:hypothetical protein EDB19DRAFT_1209690 [Suillus lakei]